MLLSDFVVGTWEFLPAPCSFIESALTSMGMCSMVCACTLLYSATTTTTNKRQCALQTPFMTRCIKFNGLKVTQETKFGWTRELKKFLNQDYDRLGPPSKLFEKWVTFLFFAIVFPPWGCSPEFCCFAPGDKTIRKMIWVLHNTKISSTFKGALS